MTRTIGHRDEDRIVGLLETLRDTPDPFEHDMAPVILRRVRRLPVPQAWAPVLTLPQFAWSAASGMVLLLLGGVGFLGMLGPGAFSSPAAALDGAHRTGGVISTLAALFARALVRGFLSLGERISTIVGPLDAGAAAAAGGAAFVCIAIVVVTVLVVSREARERRVSG